MILLFFCPQKHRYVALNMLLRVARAVFRILSLTAFIFITFHHGSVFYFQKNVHLEEEGSSFSHFPPTDGPC